MQVYSEYQSKLTPEYLAGLFDGEGCIDAPLGRIKGKYCDRPYVRPRIRMCMADNATHMMQRLHSVFGGHVYHRNAGKRNQQDSWSLEWLNHAEMRKILDLILPHLILKREQALLVLWWLDNMSGCRSDDPRFPGIDHARLAFREELQAMKRDPQRLSERAVLHIEALMRQSDLPGDRKTASESIAAPA